jgi:predicted  nucleic acid-binding Zn-ribbon protein
MFRFLKGFMKGEDAPSDLGIGDLPAWIDGEEKKARQDLAARVVAARAVMLDARRQMEEVLSGFDTASMGEVPHPKLAGVTERSLPLFLKAMRTSISRALPDEPEGFYTAAGEVLKGCLSAFRGQGRYLASRFPEEMKVLREGVDTMGREVNALTPQISRARERLRGLADLRESLARYQDAKRRASVGRKEIHSLEEEERAARASLEGVNHGLAELEKGEEFVACQGELSRIKSLEEDRNAVTRLYRASTATSVHLFRKGEKIASRKKDREAVRILHEAIDLLDRDLPIPEDSASRIIPPAQKVIAALVASGDLTPKNREEIDLLQLPERFVQKIAEISGKFRAISSEIASAQGAMLSQPALVKSRDLRKEMEDLEKRIAQAKNRLELARKEVQDLEASMKVSLDEVHNRAEGMSEKHVRVRETDSS